MPLHFVKLPFFQILEHFAFLNVCMSFSLRKNKQLIRFSDGLGTRNLPKNGSKACRTRLFFIFCQIFGIYMIIFQFLTAPPARCTPLWQKKFFVQLAFFKNSFVRTTLPKPETQISDTTRDPSLIRLFTYPSPNRASPSNNTRFKPGMRTDTRTFKKIIKKIVKMKLSKLLKKLVKINSYLYVLKNLNYLSKSYIV